MSGTRIVVARHDREESQRRQLLALHTLRRSVERCAAADTTERGSRLALIRTRLVRELHDLIAALDRQGPQAERVGHQSIGLSARAEINDGERIRRKG